MARRRRRRGKRNSSSLQLVQILGLALVLVMILLFRDEIGGGAGKLFGALGSEDVQLPEESDAGPQVDAGGATTDR
jgi:hypothetical protein